MTTSIWSLINIHNNSPTLSVPPRAVGHPVIFRNQLSVQNALRNPKKEELRTVRAEEPYGDLAGTGSWRRTCHRAHF
jgi:hypothetical protein